MSVLAGKDFLLQSGDGAEPEVFTTAGGLRTSSFSINGEAVDGTHQGSAGWKELVAGAGISSMAISGSGLFTSAANVTQMQTRCVAKTLNNYRISDGTATYTGKFQVTKFERAGEYKGEQTWSVSLESSGVVTIA